MRDDCLRQLLRGLLDLIRARIKNGSQVQFQMGFEQVATPVHLLAEHRLVLVELPRHVDVLRPLTGEHEHHRRLNFVRLSGDDAIRIASGQRLHRVRDALTNDHPPVAKGLSTHLQSKGRVGQADSGVFLEVLAQIRRERVERGFGFGREQQQLPPPRVT